jgi:hypothetical protein
MTQKQLSECVGLTFKGSVLSSDENDAVLAFEEGVFAIIEAHNSWREVPELQLDSECRFAVRGYDGFGNEKGLLELGVITQDDIDALDAEESRLKTAKERERQYDQEVRDKLDYERLKKKFEGK